LDYPSDEADPYANVEGHRDGKDNEDESYELFHGVCVPLFRLEGEGDIFQTDPVLLLGFTKECGEVWGKDDCTVLMMPGLVL
jgi:hypothetical protein